MAEAISLISFESLNNILPLIPEGLRETIEQSADPVIPALYWTVGKLRLRVQDSLSGIDLRPPRDEVETVLKTVQDEIANDDLITILVNAIENRIHEHIELAIDITSLGILPDRSAHLSLPPRPRPTKQTKLKTVPRKTELRAVKGEAK